MRFNILTPLLLAAFLLVPMAATLYIDYLWFSEVSYKDVWATVIYSRVWITAVTAILSSLLIFLLTGLSVRGMGKKANRAFIAFSSLIGGALIGFGASSKWLTVLGYLNSTSFGIADPVFGKDIGFYFFTLPFYDLLWWVLFASFAASALLGVALRLIDSGFLSVTRSDEPREMVSRLSADLPPLFPLGGVFFLLLSARMVLWKYSALYSAMGTVKGAGWTGIHVFIPYAGAMAYISLFASLLFFIGWLKKSPKPPAAGVAIVGAAFIIGSVLSFAFQAYVVLPDESNREQPYLKESIRFTNMAYGLDSISDVPFPAKTDLSLADMEESQGTMQNVRLWDWQPLLRTYKQVQLIRTYYDFADADVDRYTINGSYRQVIVSAREVNPELIPDRSWVNEHLVFTHGYGITMTPVREVTAEGLPLLYVQDIPPASPHFSISRPEIYFGELESHYALVNTLTKELDYPLGEENVYTTYEGGAGIPLGSFVRRLAIAMRFGSPEILVSGSLTKDSRILMNRKVVERAKKIAPFLVFDRDPYIVTHEGRLYWLLDAYSISDRYPYSEFHGRINYIRNPVKVVIDAYDGAMSFYMIQNEPLIETYGKIFPGVFRPIGEMPQGLRAHLRYPLDMFSVQAATYSKYHMKDPRVFYNKEDIWEIPQEMFDADTVEMEPSYAIMELPGIGKVEYMLFQTFTPRSKNNIIAWLAGRSDGEGYGELILYRFPKEKLVFGPMQMEARIDQDAQIAQQFALWSQAGTRVIRGHVIILPIKDSLLYIEPIYLRAEQQAALPELRRVIVMFNERLTMQPTLEEAMAVLFGGKPERQVSQPSPAGESDASAALRHFNAAQNAAQRGDWTAYGSELEKLREALEKMAG